MNKNLFFEKLKLFIEECKGLTRWREWNTSKLSLIFLVFYYLIIVNKNFTTASLLSFFNFVALVCLYLSFGYMINDFSDREVDKKIGKQKVITKISPHVAQFILFSKFLLGILISFPFWKHNYVFLVLLIAMYMLSAFYSLPPLRFKEKRWIGIIVASITQRALPALLCFVTFNYFGWDSFLFLLLYFIVGIRGEMVHQIKDYKNDLKTNVKTLITSIGILKGAHYILFYTIPIEVALLIVTLTVMIIKIPLLGFFISNYLLITYLTGVRITEEWLLNSVFVEESFLSSFYYFYLSIFLAIIISSLSLKFLILSFFQLIWCKDIIKEEIRLLRMPKIIFHGEEKWEAPNEDINDKLWHRIDNIFYFERWYFDAIFDDNSSLSGSISINGYQSLPETIRVNVDFIIILQDKERIEIQKSFSQNEILLSENVISVGKNKIERTTHNSILHLEKENCELTLNFRKILNGFRWGQDGKVIFTTGGDRYFMWLVPVPRAEVSGFLKTPKSICNLKGIGYLEHVYGTISLRANILYWHWGRIHLEELTLVFAEVVFKNRTRIITLVVGEGEKLIYLNSKISKTNMIVPTKYRHRKPKIPLSFKLFYQDQRIYLNLNLVVKKILNEETRPSNMQFFRNPYYARFISTADGRIVLNGKELANGHIKEILHEHSVF